MDHLLRSIQRLARALCALTVFASLGLATNAGLAAAAPVSALRLYILDCGTISAMDPTLFGFNPGEVKREVTFEVPLERGEETDLVEIPASWHLDDLPPMMFIKRAPNSHGFVNPRDIEQIWLDQFDGCTANGLRRLHVTIHPDVSGRPGVLLMHERLIEHINKHPGIRWCTFDELADDLPSGRSPRVK